MEDLESQQTYTMDDQEKRLLQKQKGITKSIILFIIILLISFIILILINLFTSVKIDIAEILANPSLVQILCLLFIGIIIISTILLFVYLYKQVHFFKNEVVKPILIDTFNYNYDASHKFEAYAPLYRVLRKMDFGEDLTNLSKIDCILGELQMRKFAIVDFEMSNTDGSIQDNRKHPIMNFKGRAIIAPIGDITKLPPHYSPSPKLQEHASLFKKLHIAFNDAWGISTEQDGFVHSQSPSEISQLPNDSTDSNAPLNEWINKQSTNGLKIQYHCIENMFILIFENTEQLVKNSIIDMILDTLMQMNIFKPRNAAKPKTLIEQRNDVAQKIAQLKTCLEELIQIGVI